jgi:hypothetical protein
LEKRSMMLKRFVALVVSLAVIIALPWLMTPGAEAGAERETRMVQRTANQDLKQEFTVADLEPVERPVLTNLQARQPYNKAPEGRLRIMPDESGRLIVKFKDSAQVRPAPVRGQVISRTGRDVTSFRDIVEAFDLSVEPAIKLSEQRLADIETRAALRSGKAQPDLAGMVYVSGPRHKMEQAARAINRLDNVEFVEIEPVLVIHRGGDEPRGACCPPTGVCLPQRTQLECAEAGGTYLGDNTFCNTTVCVPGACCTGGACTEVIEFDCAGVFYGVGTTCGADGCDAGNCCIDEACGPSQNQFECRLDGGTFIGATDCGAEPQDNPCEGQLDCGEPGAGDCFTIHGSPFCDDDDCCDDVCDILPFCCNPAFGQWIDFCVGLAHAFCLTDIGANRCLNPFTSGCFESHPGLGCLNTDCCRLVCEEEENCCTIGWNATCVQLAQEICVPGFTTPDTPDFTPFQGYLWASAYADMPLGAPNLPFNPNFYGNGGEGFSLQSPFPEGDASFDPYEGLYGLAREMLEVYGSGQELVDQGVLNPVWGGGRGAGIKIGVVEWAYYENHEDLNVTTVLPPGDQMIVISDVTEPDHGTASIGLIAAVENDFGMTGIAPDADPYFFPITSVQQGPRPLTAIADALEIFDYGDILTFSFGPGGPNNLNTRPSYHMMFTTATNLGITCFLSAGNDCWNLGEGDDLGDSGAVVVGACTPGRPYGRLSFSNYFREGNAIENGNIVHVCGWGQNVASLGYGDLFLPDGDYNRSYTATYNGTSSASPMVAGLAACLQGFALQFYGIPLSPAKVRAMAVIDQNEISNPPNRPAFEEEDGRACGPDLDFENTEVNNVVGFPSARGSGANILAQAFQGFDSNTTIEEVYTIRGNLIAGNVFSVRELDDIFYHVQSMQTSNTSRPSNMVEQYRRQLSQITYITSGQIVDVFAVARPYLLEEVTAFNVLAVTAPFNRDAIGFLELYDWNQRRWVITGVGQGGGGEALVVGHNPLFGASQFVGPENRILIRFWIWGFPVSSSFGSGNSNPEFEVRIDWIDFEASGIAVPID